MKHIGWFIIIWAMLLGFSLQLKAQHISVSAPTHVAAGENFRVAYTINTRDVEEFRMGGVGEGLEVIAGPYTSSHHPSRFHQLFAVSLPSSTQYLLLSL